MHESNETYLSILITKRNHTNERGSKKTTEAKLYLQLEERFLFPLNHDLCFKAVNAKPFDVTCSDQSSACDNEDRESASNP